MRDKESLGIRTSVGLYICTSVDLWVCTSYTSGVSVPLVANPVLVIAISVCPPFPIGAVVVLKI